MTSIHFEDDKLMIVLEGPSRDAQIGRAARLFKHELKHHLGGQSMPENLFGNRVIISFDDKSHIFTIDELLSKLSA